MKKIFKKRFKNKITKTMITGSFAKYGPYVYGDFKTKNGLSGGASVGTKGRQLYANHKNKYGQLKLRYNLETNKITPKIKFKKR